MTDRLASQRLRSVSGVERYDRLAVDHPDELRRFLREVESNGWIVKPTTKIDGSTPAYFFPRKRRFYYDPERMTYLDLLHERKHLETFLERGHWKLGRAGVFVFESEIVAYAHELDLLRNEESADPRYLRFLEGRVEAYRNLLSSEIPAPPRPSTMPDPYFKRPGPQEDR